MSSIRRKPQRTYHSPPTASTPSSSTSAWNLSRPLDASSPSASTSTSSSGSTTHRALPSSRFKRPFAVPLPLYHPLGAFALSLPPLDPTLFGFPATLCLDDDEGLPGSQRYNIMRPPQPDPVPDVAPIVAAVPAPDREAKDPSPRKRRGNKRKRKEADDSDTTYPAKKTRQTLSRAASSNNKDRINAPGTSEPAVSVRAISLPVKTQTPEPPAGESNEETSLERRSTRSSKRRTSEESEASVAPAPDIPQVENAVQQNEGPPVGPAVPITRSVSKEEGEISEEEKPPN